MRTALVAACCGALLLGACGGSGNGASTATSTSSSPTSGATTTTLEFPTTSLPCQPLSTPTSPITSPATSQASLLTKVTLQSDACVDHVIFDYDAKGTDPPGFTVSYANPPFTGDASGAPIDVAGTAFVLVRVRPGYGYDYETGHPTYTGPKSVPIARANHVRAIVETGDYEGVLTWVIGLDTKRPVSVQATGTPRHQLVVTIG